MNLRLRYKILAVASVLIGVFLYGRCGKPLPAAPTVLPQNDKEQIIVDPVKHHLTIVRDSGTQVLTLPDRESVIDIRKDGKVDVTSPQFGFEHRMFLGFQVSDSARLAGGMDGFYWKKLDLGLGVAGQLGMHTPIVFFKASYVVYDNVQLGLTYDNNRRVGACLTVRI